ncbi:DDE-domain-containing protein [Aureobasidium pullulans]|uniref:DDE-domain-containing protein n=1 Tax=Aureobasidium pullulans TaxID=5580 RepID=A0A4S9AAH5_AURPU|nr:DDE-domain-containing protein [Aureobasidium pullulans]
MTNGQRKALRDRARLTPHGRQKDLCSWFLERFGHTPSQGTISDSLSAKYDWLDDPNVNINYDAVKLRPSSWPNLEEALITWYRQNEGTMNINYTVLAEQAARLWHEMEQYRDQNPPQFSNGWIDGFKRRHNLTRRSHKKHHGIVPRVPAGVRLQRLAEARSGQEPEDPIHVEAQPSDGVGDQSEVDYSVSELECSIAQYNSQHTPAPHPAVAAARRLFEQPQSQPQTLPRPQVRPQAQPPLQAEPRRALPRISSDDEIAEQVSNACQIASQFNPADIYICDETKLYWNQSPDRRMLASETAQMLNMICCNADGTDKLPLWLIGTHQSPRAFDLAGININALNCQPLQNTIVYRLPSPHPEKFQPPAKGIIRTFKAHYRKKWLRHMCDQIAIRKAPLNKTNVLHAVRWAIQAWQSTSASAIHTCWAHSTLIPSADEITPDPSLEFVIPGTLEATLEIQTLLDRLRQQTGIRLHNTINDFIDPREEDYKDIPNAPLVPAFVTRADHEPGEEADAQARVTVKEALKALEVLRKFEEQAADEQVTLIQRT